MPKQYNVAIPREDGSVTLYRMKEWLRQHPDETPTGFHPTNSTSHQLRDALCEAGWSVKETDTQVVLSKPAGNDQAVAIDEVLGTTEGEMSDSESGESGDASFSLEYQLRDFLGQNLDVINVGGSRLKLYVPLGRDGIEYPKILRRGSSM